VLQLRTNERHPRFYTDAMALRTLARAMGVPFIVNDRVDIALASMRTACMSGKTTCPLGRPGGSSGRESSSAASAGSVRRRKRRRCGRGHLGVGPVYEARATRQTPGHARLILVAILGVRPIPIVGIGGINAGERRAQSYGRGGGRRRHLRHRLAPMSKRLHDALARSVGAVREPPSGGST